MEYLALSLTSLTQSDRGSPARPVLAPDALGDFAQAMDQAARPEGVIDPGVALPTPAIGGTGGAGTTGPGGAATTTAPLPGAAQPGQAPLGDLAAAVAPSAVLGEAAGAAPVALPPLPLGEATRLPATQARQGEASVDPIAAPVPSGLGTDPVLAGVAGVPVSPGVAVSPGVGMVPAQAAPLPMAGSIAPPPGPVAPAEPMPTKAKATESAPRTPDDGAVAATPVAGPPAPVVAGQTPEVSPPVRPSQEEASLEPAPSPAVQALPAPLGADLPDSTPPMAVGYAALPGTAVAAAAPEGPDMQRVWRGLARPEGVTVADLPGQRGGAVVMTAPEAPLQAAPDRPIQPAEARVAPAPALPGGEAGPAPSLPVRDAMFRLSRLVVPEAWSTPAGPGPAPVASGPAVPGGAAPAPVPAAPAQAMRVTIDTNPLPRIVAAPALLAQAAAPVTPAPAPATAAQPLAALPDPAPDLAAQPGGTTAPLTVATTAPVLAAATGTATPPRATRTAPDPARGSAEPAATTGARPGLEAKPVLPEVAGLDPAPKSGLSRMAPHQTLIGSDMFAGSMPAPSAPAPTPPTGAVAAAGAPAAPEFARHVTAQIAHGVADAPGQDRIALRLDPPELGGIDIGLDLRDQTLRVTIAADRASTGDLIRRHADQLISDFADAGFVGIDLSFSGQNQPRRDALAQSLLLHPDSRGPVLATVDPALVPGAAIRAAASDSGLDLRL